MTTRKPGFEEEPVPFDGVETNPSALPSEGAPIRLAKPKSGPLDMCALHEEIAAKFPKTLARLAE